MVSFVMRETTPMRSSAYYREQAARARRWARGVSNRELTDTLDRIARDFDHIAEDLERGLVEIVHPAELPQRRA
jgi:hypothetical protein